MSLISDSLGSIEQKSYHYRDLSTLGRILDFIQRPSYTTMNLLEEIQNPERRTAAEIFAPLSKRRLPEEVKGRGRELYEDTGLPEWLKTGLGLATEIAADPTTYLGLGALTRGGKAALKAGQIVTKGVPLSQQVAKGHRALVTLGGLPIIRGEKAFRGAAKAADWADPLLKYFRGGSRLPWVQEALTTSKGQEAVEEAVRHGRIQQLRGLMKGVGKKGSEVTEAAERGLRGVADEATEFYGKMRGYWEDLEKRVGLINPRLNDADDAGVALEYVLHKTTGKGGKRLAKVLGKARRGLGLQPNEQQLLEAYMGQAIPTAGPGMGIPRLAPGHTSLLARTIRGKSAAELNAISEGLGFGKMWEDDLARLASKRWRFATKSAEKATFLKNIADKAQEIGLAAEGVEGWLPFDPQTLKFLKAGKGTLRESLEKLTFDPSVHDEIMRVFRAYVSPQSQAEWLQLYDKTLGIWKAWTLGPFLPYHVRNAFSDDAWFYFLRHGPGKAEYFDYAAEAIGKNQQLYGTNLMKIPEVYGKGVGRLSRLIKGKGDLPIDEWFELAKQHRIVGTGMIAGEAENIALKPLGRMMSMGRAREDLSRLAHFFACLDGGWHPAEAAADVFRYHYNYSRDALSAFELAVPNRLFFFYRWMRMNIPGSTRNLFMHWGKHTAVAKAIRTVEEGLPGWQEKYMPEWMKERGPLRMRKGRKGVEYFLTQAWWPFAELAEVTRPGKAFIERVAPTLRIPFEMGTGKEFYYDRPIKRYPGEKRELLGAKMPPHLEYLLRQWRGVGEARRMQRRATEPGVPTGERAFNTIMAALTGARTYGFEPSREAAKRMFEMIEQMGVIKSALKQAEREKDTDAIQYLTRLLEEANRKRAEYEGAME